MASTPEIEKTIHTTTLVTAAIGVVLSPIPLADELVLLPVYAVLTTRIARQRGLERSAIPWRPIVGTALAGLAARAAVNVTVSYIPGVAAAANAASAAALTEVMGHYVDAACADPSSAKVLSMKALTQALKDRVEAWKARGVWPWRRSPAAQTA